MKKNFKKILLLSSLAFGITFAFQACKKDKDPCEDVTCLNGGTCNDGNCNCATGYEGSDCGTKANAKFVGSFKLNESCPSGSVVDYPVTISASASGANKIVIRGFGQLSCGSGDLDILATVNGRDITIDANQSFCTGLLIINSGSGTLNSSGTSISITYTYSVTGTGSETCTGTYTRV